MKLPGLDDKVYWKMVGLWAKIENSDGCTKSPDFKWCIQACWEHDLHYRYGVTLYGEPITFEEANTRLRQAIQMHSPARWFSPSAWSYWFAVKDFGRPLWNGHRTRGLTLPPQYLLTRK